MTSPDVVLELRPPLLAAVHYCVSLVVAVGIVVFVLTTGGPPLSSAVFVAFTVGITTYNTATAVSRARAHADGSLEVRNRLLLTDGTTLPLVATETPPLPRQRRRLEEQAVDLRRRLGDDARR